QRNGPYSLVIIWFAARPGFQDGDGPVSNKVVELTQCAANDPLLFIPGSALDENGLEDADQKERLKQVPVALVEEQVAVMRPIRFQDGGEYGQHTPRLGDISEGRRATRLQVSQSNG